jgi:hypothetical protein
MFFFGKKNQKTFPRAQRDFATTSFARGVGIQPQYHAPAAAQAPMDRSFLLLFFKKEALPFA